VASRTTLRSVTAEAAVANPLLQRDGLPQYPRVRPEDVEPALKGILDELRTEYPTLESQVAGVSTDKVYSIAVDRLEELVHPLDYAWGVVSQLMMVANSEPLRAAHRALQPEVVKASQLLRQSRSVYRALQAVKVDTPLWEGLPEVKRRIIESSLRSMRHSGVGLEGEDLAAFNALSLELASLSTKFSNNVMDSSAAFQLVLTDKDAVRGLPPTGLALAAQTAVNKGHTGATPETGPWVLTLAPPSYGPAMQHIADRGLRETLFRAFITRASSGDHDNAPVLTRILALRQKRAQLLGYGNHAELSLASKRARSVGEVDALLRSLRDASYEPAKAELREVEAFARLHGFEEPLALWDVPYWLERQKEARFTFTQEELRPYLALPNVLAGLFALCERLFGVQIVAADGEAEVWHPDVRFFKVLDEGAHVASFFLDPYSRPGTKRGGAWQSNIQDASRVLDHKPVASLVCNSTPPMGGTPSLMTFGEVSTLFHETGHGLQAMLTTVREANAAGTRNVEWDAVELPSQFMENWCYDRRTLYSFARHHATEEPLPEALYQKLLAQRTYSAGLQMLRSVYLSQVDMELHHHYDPSAGSETPFDVMRRVAATHTVLPPLPEDRFLCAFDHLFAGGYSAGYYSYKWAEVMSADAFAAFEEAGLDDEAAVRAVGRRFRSTVLALGGSRHPSDVFRDFRGRDPSPAALLRHAGLAA